MATAKSLTELYEREKDTTSKYVHATSRGHEAAQLALALQLEPKDYVAPYYRDDSILLGIGMTPKDLMLQLLAKIDDPFSGGRTYYSHPSLKDDDKPKIPHQSSATGMQAIPTAGVAMGIQYRERQGLATDAEKGAIAVCSIGDSAMTEGEISEAMHMAALKQFPLLMFVQDNGWDISANRNEVHHSTAVEYAKGFAGIETRDLNGSNFKECFTALKEVITIILTVTSAKNVAVTKITAPTNKVLVAPAPTKARTVSSVEIGAAKISLIVSLNFGKNIPNEVLLID